MNVMLAILLYVGCQTSTGNTNGLHRVELDAKTGRMTDVDSVPIVNPLYLAQSADGRWLYANEADGLGSFSVSADGRLTHVDRIGFGARAMCHLAFMPGEGELAWAAYTTGEAGLVRIRDGRFLSEIRHDRHTGRGPDWRQDFAHCHMAVPTPDGRHYAVVDLGIDSIVTYSVADPKAPGVACRTSRAGAGPRHLVFHPDGRHAFVVFELGSRLASYAWSEKDGFRELDNVSTLPEDWHGLNQDAAIRFTPDGKRIVVSNRGYDSLTVFDFDLATGKLAFKARSVLPGSWPRDFVFVPGTDLAIVAMERSGTLLAVRYDAATGVFTPVDSLHGLVRPVTVLVAHAR